MPSKSIDTLFPKVETLNKKLLLQAKKKTENKIASAQYRKDILESQNRNNYRNEYDRITGHLQNTKITPAEARKLSDRRKDLKNLAKQSINPTPHPVFQM
jgi:hypothetical protein